MDNNFPFLTYFLNFDAERAEFKKKQLLSFWNIKSSYVKQTEKDRYAQVKAFYILTSSLSSTSIPPSLSSSICLCIMRRASRLNRSSSVKHGGLRELQGSKGGKTNQNRNISYCHSRIQKSQSITQNLRFVWFEAHSLQFIDDKFSHKRRILTKKWKHTLFSCSKKALRRHWYSLTPAILPSLPPPYNYNLHLFSYLSTTSHDTSLQQQIKSLLFPTSFLEAGGKQKADEDDKNNRL